MQSIFKTWFLENKKLENARINFFFIIKLSNPLYSYPADNYMFKVNKRNTREQSTERVDKLKK